MSVILRDAIERLTVELRIARRDERHRGEELRHARSRIMACQDEGKRLLSVLTTASGLDGETIEAMKELRRMMHDEEQDHPTPTQEA